MVTRSRGILVSAPVTLLACLGLLTLLPSLTPTGQAHAQTSSRQPAGQSARVPKNMVGNWFWGTASLSGYVDRNTGAYLGSSYSGGATFEFLPNGQYRRYVLIQTRLSGDSSEIFAFSQGTVVFNEATSAFTLKPTKGEYTFTDGRKKRNRPMTKDELNRAGTDFLYEFRTGDGKTSLYIRRKTEKPDEARLYQRSNDGKGKE